MSDTVYRAASIEQYNFLDGINIESQDRLVNKGNVVDNTETYISRWYTPNLKVSNATNKLVSNISKTLIRDTNLELDPDSVTYWLLHSNLRIKDYKVYNVFRATMADVYTYTYAIDDNPDFLKYISKDDFTRTINNVSYLIDYLSTDNANTVIVNDLIEINIDLGVLKNQLDFIKNDYKESGIDA